MRPWPRAGDPISYGIFDSSLKVLMSLNRELEAELAANRTALRQHKH